MVSTAPAYVKVERGDVLERKKRVRKFWEEVGKMYFVSSQTWTVLEAVAKRGSLR